MIKYIFTMLLVSAIINCNGMGSKTEDNSSRTILGALVLNAQTKPASLTSVSSIEFNVVSGTSTTSIGCNSNMTGTIGGSTNSSLTDLRFYIHDVKLLSQSGTKVDYLLTDDKTWQVGAGSNSFGTYPSLALLDFEDKTGNCSSGTIETNKRITGTAISGQYTGVEFKIGVPFNLNHLDSTTAVSPLNNSAMYWAWNSGYKFIKIEYKSNTTNSTDNRFHLGSGTCTGNASGPVNACTYPNRPTITVQKTSGLFDPTKDKITLDIAALFQGADGNTLTTGSDTAIRTCMSGNTATACQPIIRNVGVVPETGVSATTQTSFSIR